MFRFFKWFSVIVIIGLFGFLIQIAWWVWYPYNIIDFSTYCCNKDGTYFNGIVLNENKKVKRGDFLHVELEFDKKYDIIANNVIRQLMNDRYVTLVCNEKGTLPKGKQKRKFTVYIPQNIWPGEYKLLNTFTYRPNPLPREIKETWSSEWFEVLP